MAIFLIFRHKICHIHKDRWEIFVFLFGKTSQYEVDIADAVAELVVTSAKAEARKIFRTKMRDGGLEAVIAASAAPFAEAYLAERQIKIITN